MINGYLETRGEGTLGCHNGPVSRGNRFRPSTGSKAMTEMSAKAMFSLACDPNCPIYFTEIGEVGRRREMRRVRTGVKRGRMGKVGIGGWKDKRKRMGSG